MTSKRYSFRPELEVASRLDALCALHPRTARHRLLVELISLGLIEFERTRIPSNRDRTDFHSDPGRKIYLPTGPFSEFRGLLHKHHLALEHELAKDDAQARPIENDYTLGDLD